MPCRPKLTGVAHAQCCVYSLSHGEAQFSATICGSVEAIGLDTVVCEIQSWKPEWYALALSSGTFHGVLGYSPAFLLRPSC